MDLDRRFEPGVVRVGDVGVAPADMRDDDRVFLRGQRLEEVARGRAVALHAGAIGEEGARRAPDRPPFVAKVDVVVAADGGVAGPLVAGEGDEPAIVLELGGEAIELLPERLRDLEVVGLVPHHVEEGEVAGEGEVGPRAVDADRLAALAVQIAPVGP